jgi:hypothetical protein
MVSSVVHANNGSAPNLSNLSASQFVSTGWDSIQRVHPAPSNASDAGLAPYALRSRAHALVHRARYADAPISPLVHGLRALQGEDARFTLKHPRLSAWRSPSARRLRPRCRPLFLHSRFPLVSISARISWQAVSLLASSFSLLLASSAPKRGARISRYKISLRARLLLGTAHHSLFVSTS